MSSRTPSVTWTEPARPDRQPHLGVPSPETLATMLLWVIVIVCAALLGLALGSA